MFLLFAGVEYYPSGGWDDFKGAFPNVEAAKDWLLDSNQSWDWWHIVDVATHKIVRTKGGA